MVALTLSTMPASIAQSLSGTPLNSSRGALTSSDSPFRQPVLGAIKADGTDSEDVSSPQRLMPEFRNSAILRARAVDNQLDLDATKQREAGAGRSLVNKFARPSACSDEVASLLQSHTPSSRTYSRLRGEGMPTSRGGVSQDEADAISNCGSPSDQTEGLATSAMQKLSFQANDRIGRKTSTLVHGSHFARSGTPLVTRSSSAERFQGSSSTTLEAPHGARRSARASLPDWGTQSGAWRGWDKWGGWREKHREEEGDRNLANPDLGATEGLSLRNPDERESVKTQTGNFSSAPQAGENLTPKE
jgi:hypothetical protein